MLKNLIPQSLTIINDAAQVVAKLPPSGVVARAIAADPVVGTYIAGIPTVVYTPFTRIEGLPAASDPDPIVVPHLVADAMRQLGLKHPAGVYSPQPLVFDASRNPLGTLGLIHHTDLS